MNAGITNVMTETQKELFLSFINSELFKEIFIAFLILLAFVLFRKFCVTYIFNQLKKMTEKTTISFDNQMLVAFEKPFRFLFIIIGVYVSLKSISIMDFWDGSILRLLKSTIIFSISWGFMNLFSANSYLFKNVGKKFNLELEETISVFLSRIIKVFIVGVSISIIAQVWGYDFNGFIAGLGLGGLAFALAAQEIIKNLFSGVVILTEQPFKIGDWIKTPSVEGTVEGISLRSTTVRTFPNALVTIPNSTLTNEAIINWSKMGKRRITFNLPVKSSTPSANLKRSVDKIRDMLVNHEDIHKDTIFIHFDTINNGNYELYFYFFTSTTVWGEWLAIKEDINFKIISILEEESVELAYPSQSIYVEGNTK